MNSPDWGRAANDYARHRQGFTDRLYQWIEATGSIADDVLDLGTGTGLVACEMARRGGRVTGLDPSTDMLAAAAEAAERQGLAIDLREAMAEKTGLPDNSFDLIIAGTCWHWFDRSAAAAEAFRLLRPSGRLVIAHQDWLRRPGNVIDVTLEAIYRWNRPPADRKWTFQYPEWLFELTDAGFADYEITAFPVQITYSHEAWVGRIVASAMIGPALDSEQLHAFRPELGDILKQRFPEDPLDVEHRVFAICLTRP